jgi:hypothetical protein
MTRRLAWWTGLVCGTAIAILWALNMPFYAGAGGRTWCWRLEHGRLLIEHRPVPVNPQRFYIAANREGLRFRPDWRFSGPTEWMINVPLWMPLAACCATTAWGWRRPKRGLGRCPCGYDLKGLKPDAPCPECGSPTD